MATRTRHSLEAGVDGARPTVREDGTGIPNQKQFKAWCMHEEQTVTKETRG
jgi:hypothetical protein